MRMVQRRRRARFTDEALEPIGVADELFREHFERDGAPQFQIVGAIDLAHPSGSEQRSYFVAAESGAGKVPCCRWRHPAVS
jgi:hypothetical protein